MPFDRQIRCSAEGAWLVAMAAQIGHLWMLVGKGMVGLHAVHLVLTYCVIGDEDYAQTTTEWS